MKRIIIGRANDCDIIIPDNQDNVSRHHAVISFNFFGSMKLSDTSSNGTFINDKRMLRGTSMPVTRNDKIKLGDNWIFDWSLVEDPYKSLRKNCIISIVTLFIMIIGVLLCIWYNDSTKKEEQPVVTPQSEEINNSDTWNKDSTERVAPSEHKINTPETQKETSKKSKQNTPSKKVSKPNELEKKLKEGMDKAKEPGASDKQEVSEMPVIN